MGTYEVKLTQLARMRVAIGREVGLEPEDLIVERMKLLIGGTVGDFPVRYLGLSRPVTKEEAAKGYRSYECWATIPDDFNPVTYFETKEVEPGCYAVYRLANPFANPAISIPNAWARLGEWVRATYPAFKSEGLPFFEEVVHEGSRVYMDFYHPLWKV